MDPAPDQREEGDIRSDRLISLGIASGSHTSNSPCSSQTIWSSFIQSRLDHVRAIESRDQPDRVANARQAVERELSAMHLATCSLHSRWNSLTTPSLPSDVLARVFWYCTSQDVQKYSPTRLGWMLVTHVCRYWRDVALQHSEIWDKPDLELGPRWVCLMLSRAKKTPLWIQFSLSNLKTETSDLIAAHISQIRHLSLIGAPSDLQSMWQSASSSVNILESLELSTWYGSNVEFVLSDELRDMFPQLRRIKLTSIPIHWSSPILRGLTHLELRYLWSNQNYGWGSLGDLPDTASLLYDQFFLALERLPALEVLILKYALPLRPQHSLRVLSHLSTLSFYDETWRCLDIVQQLRFPSSCCVSLDCRSGALRIQDVADVRGVLNNNVSGLDPAPPLILSVLLRKACGNTNCIQLRIWRNRELLAGEPDVDLCSTPRLFLQMPYPSDPTMDALCDALSLDSLRILHVRREFGSPFARTPQRWIELFHRCRAVEHVHVAHIAVPFIVALGLPIPHSSPSEHDNQDGPEDQRLFPPNLQSLTLKRVNLEARLPKKAKTACESIVQRLAVRKQLKALPTIRVSADCLVGPESKEALETVADVVQWLSEPEED